MNREQIITEVFEKMRILGHQFHKADSTQDVPKDCPTRAQLGILIKLSDNAYSIKDLAYYFGVSPSAATQLVDGLVKDKLIIKKEDNEDRRKIILTLTTKGKTALASSRTARMATLTKLLEPLTEKELTSLLEIEEKIIKHWKK